MELGMISSTWLDTKIGAARRHPHGEGDRLRHVRRLRGSARPDRRGAAGDQGDGRGGRAADPLASSASRSGSSTSTPRCAGSRSTGSRRTSTRARSSGRATSCSSSASTTGTARCSPRAAIWDMAKEMVKEAGEYAQSKGLEIVLELEPFDQALLKDVHELARFVNEIGHPAVRANADISHLHLSDASFDDVKELSGLIGHIHLSDCDGKVHGDLPAGHGRDADQGVPRRDPRHRLRRHRLDRARVLARSGARSSSGRSRPTTGPPRSCASSASAS